MVKLKLKEFLDAHDITAYRLGQVVEELDVQTIYHYVRGTRTPSLNGLEAVLKGLRKLTGKPVSVSDILEFPVEGQTEAFGATEASTSQTDPAHLSDGPGDENGSSAVSSAASPPANSVANQQPTAANRSHRTFRRLLIVASSVTLLLAALLIGSQWLNLNDLKAKQHTETVASQVTARETRPLESEAQQVALSKFCEGPEMPVTISDPNLETSVRVTLQKMDGKLSCADMATLEVLSAHSQGIRSLEGLQYAVHLRHLIAYNNQLRDLSPLEPLTKLEVLILDGNHITDASVKSLRNLVNLTSLGLGQNQLSDLSFLESLQKLGGISLNDNQISDITPLKHLTNVREIWLQDNRIQDVSVLADLPKLKVLRLQMNRITDISPLAHAEGLRNDSVLSLEGNCLNFEAASPFWETHKVLVARGVIITYEPQRDCSELETHETGAHLQVASQTS